ncbi:VOC family protein [Luteipulveratus mongoliensis]|nr:VOC family protein [Luteipulveratus mongoliensis]
MPVRSSYGPGTPCWFAYACPEPASALEFYGAQLGWSSVPHGPGQWQAALPSGTVCSVSAGPRAAWTVCLATADIDASVGRLATHGARVLMPPRDVGAGHLALGLDRGGHVFGLFSGATKEGIVTVDEPGAVVGVQLRSPSAAGLLEDYAAICGGPVEGVQTVDSPDGVNGWLPVFGTSESVDLQQVSVVVDPYGAAYGLSARPG